MNDQQFYDVIVVGGGSAGAALATRLSENESRQVLLVEAGSDYPTLEAFPLEISWAPSMAASFPGHPSSWNFVGELAPGRGSFPFTRGKIIGGSSAINGTYFIRARPVDFDNWAAAGNDLWSYEQVLPYFRKSEHDLNFSGEYHGQDGPMPVARPREDQLRPVSQAFMQACVDAGFPEDPDKNAPGAIGIGPVPRNVQNGYRMNTAVTYLAPARGRANLTVVGETFVRRVLLDGNRVVGVEAERDGRPVEYRAAEVVLTAGAIKSSHLLMLSGIGPADELRKHGIDVVHDSAGVGRNVLDHPSVHVNFKVRDDGVPLPNDFMVFQTCLNHTAPGSSEPSDVQITCGAAPYSAMLRAAPSTGGRRPLVPSYLKRPVATINALRKLPTRLVLSEARMQDNLILLVSLDAEKSRGTFTLRSSDPREQPEIRMNYLSHPDDLPRLTANLKLAVELLKSPAFKRLGLQRVAPSDEELASDATIHSWIRTTLATAAHSHNSTHMGPASDPEAVVDQRGRVHGVEGLRVADLSIVPRLRRGPAATAVMLGERVAGLMEEEQV
jgi:choline dehydrogenase